jgi:hypothetical protein
MPKLGDTVTGARMLGSRIAATQRQSNPDGRMPLMDHIRELRNRLLKAVAAVLLGTVIGLIPVVYDRLWNFVQHPFIQAEVHDHAKLAVIGVLDPFMIRVQIAFYFGLVVTSPIWLYQFWAFIAPGLYRREKRWTYAFVFTAAPLFLVGATLAYFVMSRGLRYLLALAPAGVTELLPGHDARLRARVRAAAGPGHAEHGRHPHARADQEVAPVHDLRRVRVRRRRLAQP